VEATSGNNMSTNIEAKSDLPPTEIVNDGTEKEGTVHTKEIQNEEPKKVENKTKKKEDSKKKEEKKEEKKDDSAINNMNSKTDGVPSAPSTVSPTATTSASNSTSTTKKEGNKRKDEKRAKDKESEKQKDEKKDSQTQPSPTQSSNSNSNHTPSNQSTQSQSQTYSQSKKEEKKEGKKWEVKDHKKAEKKEETPSLSRVDESGKHKLQSSWTFWYDKKQANKKPGNYEDNLIQIGSFDTLEDFWNLYTYLKRPNELSKECNYHLFRSGMKPMWESFPKGGCFIKKVKKSEPSLSRMWEELLFATIGESFEDPDVVGVVLSTRPKEDILSIWNMDHQNQSLRLKIGEKLKEIWELDPNTPIEYKNHSASMKDKNTYHSHVKQFFV